ncbi:MAG: Gfo/Idh/MocA family oxidoreductase [Tissierellia bacterium]|nr:Gfo/Idh/MocA family oxidoreductase [Tissierellia bacterium]
MIKVAVIGAGHRGNLAYASQFLNRNDIKAVSFTDTDEEKLKIMQVKYNLSDEYLFNSTEEFFKALDKEKFCDAVIIATPDRDHFETCMKVLDYDLHILLEKPISSEAIHVKKIAQKAAEKNKVFMICHVLRYAPLYTKIKELLNENAIGEIININHNENIGYYHFAHSFVRGNWRNEELSSPLILQKSCHDMDILLYFLNKKPINISSYGSLKYFNKKNQPEDASDRCYNCKYQDSCIFSSTKFYESDLGKGWRSVVTNSYDHEGLMKDLKEGPYGRCVYECDNDVCDHQSISIEFEDGVTAVFNLSAFSNHIHRNIKIQGTKGEMWADDFTNEITVRRFKENESKTYYVSSSSGHGGGDIKLMEAFIDAIKGDSSKVTSGANESVMSHFMCFASEKSRKENIKVDIDEFIRGI